MGRSNQPGSCSAAGAAAPAPVSSAAAIDCSMKSRRVGMVLKKVSQSKLHDAGIAGTRDPRDIAIVDARFGQAKIRVVEDVKELAAKLQLAPTLRNWEGLDQR